MRWKRRFTMTGLALAVCVAAALGPGCRTAPRQLPAPVTTEEVVAMSAAGEPPETIIASIERSETVYLLKARDVQDLLERGVDERIVDYMLETRIRQIEEFYRSSFYYYPYYPHFRSGFYYCW